MGDRLGTPGVVGFSYHDEDDDVLQKRRTYVRYDFFSYVTKHDSAIFRVAFFGK